MSEHRRQHFIPAFYLAGFTPSGLAEDYLNVIDQNTRRTWRSKPTEAAHSRDFYRIDMTDVDPNMLERFLGQVEADTAAIVHDFEASGTPPTGEAHEKLMTFISFLVARVPAHRELISESMGQIAKMMMEMTVATPERWASRVSRMKKEGIDLTISDYSEMKDFVDRGEYKIEANQTWLLGLFLQEASTLYPTMMARNWAFIRADEQTSGYICSDHPVGLIWTKEMPPFYRPGFGMPDTELTVPLTRKWALIGRFDKPANVGLADRATVAALNSRTGMSAGQIYHPSEDFVWTMLTGEIGGRQDLLDAIRGGKEAS